MKTSKKGKAQPSGPHTMIIETHYCNRQEMLSMTHDEFTVDGVTFKITGTSIDEFGEATCAVKNLSNGKTNYLEHQKLCRIIKGALEKEAAKQLAPLRIEEKPVSKPVFEAQTLNL